MSLLNHSHLPNSDVTTILNIPILCRLSKQRIAWLQEMIGCPRQHHIVTANPEILVQAVEDERYRSIIQASDAIVADGFGIVLVGFFQGKKVERQTGVELAQALLRIAESEQIPIHFALYGSGLTTLDDVRAAFPKMPLANPHEAAIVMANFGAPKQEYWLHEHRDEFPNARILVGVGGALDYLCGKVRRAPWILRAIGLEWFWRLVRQPKRWKRIWHAVVVFPLKVIL